MSGVDPGDPRALMERARERVLAEDYRGGLDAADAAVRLAPESSWAHRLRSLALVGLRRSREARMAAEEAVRLWPDSPEALIVLSRALTEDGDPAGALAAADHAVRLAPEHAGAHEQRGIVLGDHERWGEAEDAFLRTLALSPDSANAQNNLAIALLAQGRRDEALAGLERAARTDPALEIVHRNLRLAGVRPYLVLLAAWAYLLLGFALLGSALAVADEPSATAIGATALCVVLIVAVFLGVRHSRPVSAPSRALIADRRRALRWRPWRWDWRRVTQLRPWWWIAMERLSPWKGLGLNVVATIVTIPLLPLALMIACGLPFSIRRVWRWERRRRPGTGSWRPPAS